MLQHPGLRPLWEGLRHEWRQQLLAGGALAVVGLLIVTWGVFSSGLLALTGLGILLGGLYIVQHVWRRPPDRHRLRELICHHPARIVWVYGVVTEHQPFGVHFLESGILYFKLLDGDEITVAMPARRLKLVCKLLGRVLPHTVFGYSRQRHRVFDQNPALLRRQD